MTAIAVRSHTVAVLRAVFSFNQACCNGAAAQTMAASYGSYMSVAN